MVNSDTIQGHGRQSLARPLLQHGLDHIPNFRLQLHTPTPIEALIQMNNRWRRVPHVVIGIDMIPLHDLFFFVNLIKLDNPIKEGVGRPDFLVSNLRIIVNTGRLISVHGNTMNLIVGTYLVAVFLKIPNSVLTAINKISIQGLDMTSQDIRNIFRRNGPRSVVKGSIHRSLARRCSKQEQQDTLSESRK
jgi:hypothetical protein